MFYLIATSPGTWADMLGPGDSGRQVWPTGGVAGEGPAVWAGRTLLFPTGSPAATNSGSPLFGELKFQELG